MRIEIGNRVRLLYQSGYYEVLGYTVEGCIRCKKIANDEGLWVAPEIEIVNPSHLGNVLDMLG